MAINVRLYQETDTQVLAHLYFDAVRNGTIEFYSTEQREAWARDIPDVSSWTTRLARVKTFVAEKEGVIAGFGRHWRNRRGRSRLGQGLNIPN